MKKIGLPVVSERVHHVVAIIAIWLLSFGGFEALAAVNNLYQPAQYVYLSLLVYLVLVLWLLFIFDLHFRDRSTPLAEAESFGHAFRLRCGHLAVWKNIRHLYNCAILPGVVYWGTVLLVGINFGHVELQQVLVVTSSVALVVCYTLFKEIFRTKNLPVSNVRFLLLYYVKLYASWLAYAAALGVVWYYCFPPAAFYTLAFAVTFTLKYQALYQYNSITLRNVALATLVALAMAAVSYFVFVFWNVNYFSAGLFMTAIYNLAWGLFFHSVNKNFTRDNIFENLVIFVIMLVLVFGTTNFAERISRC